MHRLILAGGGHAHLSVLHALAAHRSITDVVMITPSIMQTYSGMLPGWLAGHYSLSDCQIDLRPLAKAAGVELIIDHVAGMDADRRCVALSDGTPLNYGLLSLDIGGETDLSWLETLGNRLLPIKPLDKFVQRWPELITQATKRSDYHLIVVGGGAAGVEIALAAQYAFSKSTPGAAVTLVASENGILSGHASAVISRIRKLLEQRGISLHESLAVGVEDGVLLGNGQHLQADTVIAATGSVSPYWLKTSKLGLDEHGYISVEANHRSQTHHDVFAAGDVCARTDTSMVRSGVHAVLAGPVLAHNLIASMNNGTFSRYRPRKRSLYLLATGPKHAVASWGPLSAAGHWVWRWKNWIDSGFMNKHKI